MIRKKVFILVALIVISFLFSACRGGEDSSSDGSFSQGGTSVTESIVAAESFAKMDSFAAGTESSAMAESFPMAESLVVVTESFPVMDTYVTLTVHAKGKEQGRELLEESKGKLEGLERLWSVTDEESELYQVNHGDGAPVTVSPETREVLSFALEEAAETDGALDPTIYPVLAAWGFTTGENRIPSPEEIQELLDKTGYEKVVLAGDQLQLEEGMMLDLGAVAKGYAGDMLEEFLQEKGIVSALLDLGGNIQAVGAKPDGSLWNLGLQDPFGEGVFASLKVRDCAVVTSGTYERFFVGEDGKRYGHIIDPDTGYPADNGLASVTVVADRGLLCDALSTALFVMGRERAAEFWRERQDFQMILVTADREVLITEGLEEIFTLDWNHKKWDLEVLRP